MASRHLLDPAHVGQEAHQLVGLCSEPLRARLPVRLVGEKRRIMLLDHAGAGAGGRDHIVVAFEGGDHAFRDRRGVTLVAGIVGGLAAAGLRLRHFHAASRVLQQLQRREADRGAEKVDETGHEEADPWGGGDRLAHWRSAKGAFVMGLEARLPRASGVGQIQLDISRQCGRKPAQSPFDRPGKRP